MNRKVISLCLILIFSLACPSYALDWSNEVFGDWEQSMDGWESWNPNNIITYSTTGVTHGSYSLRVDSNYPSSNFWYSTELGYKFIGEDARNAFFFSWNIFSIDVTTLASEWIPNSNAGWSFGTDIALIINAGDNEGNSMYKVLTQYLRYPNEADITQTLTWDYRAERNTLLDWGLYDYTKGYVEFVLLMRWPTFEPAPDGTGGGGVYYLDEARLWTPEPTTIAFMALGALALFRKKS